MIFNYNITKFNYIADNPLVCDCELRWYRDWIKNLREKDDEMMQKKRTMCTMEKEHREYSVQNLPLEKMDCVGKKPISIGNSGSKMLGSMWQNALVSMAITIVASARAH